MREREGGLSRSAVSRIRIRYTGGCGYDLTLLDLTM